MMPRFFLSFFLSFFIYIYIYIYIMHKYKKNCFIITLDFLRAFQKYSLIKISQWWAVFVDDDDILRNYLSIYLSIGWYEDLQTTNIMVKWNGMAT